ncbi:YdcF family protein [Candidatus Kuenenbacteria bacterium]|nr:YdcF family protein [Candidatus Kuenenbacteria bacterium]
MYYLLAILILWLILILAGDWLACRSKLTKADCLICLSGTRGRIKFAEDKIKAVQKIFTAGYTKNIIFTSFFAFKVNGDYKPIGPEEINYINKAVTEGRVTPAYAELIIKNGDFNLGAIGMRDRALSAGIPMENTFLCPWSLNTKEEALAVFELCQSKGWQSAILLTAPFHQKRAYLTFKAFAPTNFKLISYSAETSEWPRFFWFLKLANLKLFFNETIKIIKYSRQRKNKK